MSSSVNWLPIKRQGLRLSLAHGSSVSDSARGSMARGNAWASLGFLVFGACGVWKKVDLTLNIQPTRGGVCRVCFRCRCLMFSKSNFEQFWIWAECKICIVIRRNCSNDLNLTLIPLWVKNDSLYPLLSRSTIHTKDNKDLRGSTNSTYVHKEKLIIHRSNKSDYNRRRSTLSFSLYHLSSLSHLSIPLTLILFTLYYL